MIFSFTDVRNCKDLKKKGYAKIDGHYFFYPIANCGKALKVYCYDMDTNEPKDFITLPSGPVNNFGYVYAKRMEISKKFDDCTGSPGPVFYSKSGRTNFYKVKDFYKSNIGSSTM